MAFERLLKDYLVKNIDEIFFELSNSIGALMKINKEIQYIDGTKLEADAGKYTFVYKTRIINARKKLWQKISDSIADIRIGDSDQAEAVRRKLDTHTSKELPKLKKQRGIKNDEITGEPLGKNAAFHHSNEKELFTDPVDVLDENKGINVNNDTHKEIHKQNIRTADELKKKSVSIKKVIVK